jgi:hypothetical protein
MRAAGAVKCLIKSGLSEDLIRTIHDAVPKAGVAGE